MNRGFLAAAVILCAMVIGNSMGASAQDMSRPRYTGGNLVRPADYREWVYLSSGLGMNYNPTVGKPELFTNVFVPQWAYRQFTSTGKWPDKTVFALEDPYRLPKVKARLINQDISRPTSPAWLSKLRTRRGFRKSGLTSDFGRRCKDGRAKPKETTMLAIAITTMRLWNTLSSSFIPR